MKNPFKNAGFRSMIFKGTIFLILAVIVQKIVQLFLVKSLFFKNFLDIPQQFQIGKGIIAISITNAIIFGFVVFVMLSYKRLVRVKTFKFKARQLWFLLPTIFFLVLHFVLKFLINRNIEFFSETTIFWGIVKIFIQLLFLASLFFAVFGLEFFRYMLIKFKKQIIVSILVTVTFFILMILIQNLWTYFSSVISDILYRIFSLFFDNVTYRPFVTSFTMAEGGGPLLGINDFKAIIGKPCSGIDSFLLFTSLYALIFMLDYKRLKKKLTIAIYFIGILGIFMTNILRILLLFIIGAYIDADLAIGLFHTNAGWILFIGYFFIFWFIVSKYIYKKGVK